MRHIVADKGILMWHRNGRYYAVQGVHRASVHFEGDVVRDGQLRRVTEIRVLAALVRAKIEHQNLSRPPAPDSRPQRCHAQPIRSKPGHLGCRMCKQRWHALDQTYPGCKP
jgi:hypothetical protein